MTHSMRLPTLLALTIVFGSSLPARAQDPPPPIGPVVVDLRGILPKFPNSLALAQSRSLEPSELPGRGIGIEGGLHVYPLKRGATTIGLGGQLTLARSLSTPQPPLAGATTRFTAFASQLSLNFGTGDGWSYISGGIGATRWSIVPDGREPQVADQAWVRTFDYGGGARWFAKPRVAFHIDVRLHAIDPGPVQLVLPGSPRVNLLIIGAGISLKERICLLS
jgi:hypothetical protein